MTPFRMPVLAAFDAYVAGWLANDPPDPAALLALFDGQDVDDLADLIDVYLLHSQHRPPVTDEARAFVARIIEMSDRMDTN